MLRAGFGVAKIARHILLTEKTQSVLLIAGVGNNGGDAFVAAKELSKNIEVEVWICGDQHLIKGDALLHLENMIHAGIQPKEIQSERGFFPKTEPALIIDGLLGIGSRGSPRGLMGPLIDWINIEAQNAFVLSIDLPSGIDADTGIAEGSAVKADLTATIGLPKTGLIRPEAIPNIGNVEVIDIGIPLELIEDVEGNAEAAFIDQSDLFLPRRPRDSHKGTYGHILIIGGAKGTTGAVAMAARDALRSGAGLVSVLTPDEVYPIVAQACGPEVMVHTFPSIGKLAVDFSKDWKKIDAVLIGPGLEPAPETVKRLLKSCPVPLVLDAGALCVTPQQVADAKCPIVLTPHPGEFERMFGSDFSGRWAQAAQGAAKSSATLLLKGAGTVIATPGRKLAVNLTGNPGMATGGMGDVLGGMVTAFLGQGMPAFDAAITAVYLHGLAGDIAADRMGQESLIATDLIDALPDAFRALQIR